MTNKTIEFYFDFLSPYGYLGSLGIEEIAKKHQLEVDWRPFLLGVTVMRVMGLPPVPDTPLKGPYAALDIPRTFAYRGVAHNPGPVRPYPPLPAGRAYTWLKDQDDGLAKRFAQTVYSAHWSEGRDVSTAHQLADVGHALGIDRDRLMASVSDSEVKTRHKQWVDLAVANGVFGAPTFVIDGEMFWGSDKLEQVDAWIERGGW
jgi:2-hydroxychromene-2-carboxylate isomerase